MTPLLEQIKAVRSTNNDLWMALVEVALQAAPQQAKAILRDIRTNDQKISDLLGELANG